MRDTGPPAVEDFAGFLDRMSGLLGMMGRAIVEDHRFPVTGGELASQSFLGEGYECRLACLGGGARPFWAFVEKPWRHRICLGRLDKDGKVRISSHGLRQLHDFLAEIEILGRFFRDLERALTYLAKDRNPQDREGHPWHDGAFDPGGRLQ
ncbi:MAG: hypothetical protein GYA47_10780 [Desulfovibrio sp.]|nr:hypothetical protein [Desulfovibrio sp.]